MLPSEALYTYLNAEKQAHSWQLTPKQTQTYITSAALAFDQAVYDMGRRGYLGLPMVGPARQPRGSK